MEDGSKYMHISYDNDGGTSERVGILEFEETVGSYSQGSTQL